MSLFEPTVERTVEWVRPPRQTRSQVTYERLLDAAEEVVSSKGFENATVAEIVSHGQSSVGAFYARFRDKEALLNCLHERFCEQAIATADACLAEERWEGASIADILRELLPFLVQIYQERRGLIRTFIVRGSVDTRFSETASRLGNHISEGLTRLLLARAAEMRHPNPALAADFALRMSLALLDATCLFPTLAESSPAMKGPELASELLRAFLGYLGIPEDAGADGTP